MIKGLWAVAALLFAIWLAGCAERPEAEQRRPQQAGQPLDPVATAARIASIRGSAVLGDQEGVRKGMEAMHEDFRKSIKLADPARKIDRESARTAARSVDGVRSVVWVDHVNLLVIVERNEQRTYETIDHICLELEPLGDTLGVVVNLQSGAATNGDELEIVSRNCQLAPGDRALLQANRKIDVVDPKVRAQYQASKDAALARRDREAEQAESMRILEATTPEM